MWVDLNTFVEKEKHKQKKWVKPEVKAIVIKSADGGSTDGISYSSGFW